MKRVDPALKASLSVLITSMGYEFVGMEFQSQGRHSTLRIFIDKQNGVTIDDCSRVSYQVSAMLDVKDPIAGHYNLEVSSPGIDRPLFELDHFMKFTGKRIKVKLSSPVDGRKQFKGVLLRIEGEKIYLLIDGLEQEIILPFSSIEKANLIGAHKADT